MNLSLGKLFVEIGATFKAFSDTMNRVEERVVKTADSLTQAGQSLSIAVSAPLAAVGIGALKAAIDFEAAFASVRKNVDGTAAELEKIEGQIRALATTMPATAAEISAVASTAGQLGVETENIVAFAQAMVMVGETTNLTAETAATSLAQLAAVTKLPHDQFDRLASVVLALGKSTETTEARIVEMGQRISGVGAQIGLSEHQIVAFAAALGSVGIEAEAGGTAISTVFAEVASAVAMGGEKLENFAEIAGMTAESFAKEFRVNAAGALNEFIIGLGRVQKAGGNVFAVLESVEFADRRVRNALLSLAGAGDKLTETLAKAKAEWSLNETLVKTYEERLKTMKAQLEIIWNRFTELRIVLGEALMPALQAVATTTSGFITILTEAAKVFASLPAPIRAVAFFMGVMSAAIGPLLIAIGGMVRGFYALRTAAVALTPALNVLAKHPLAMIAVAIATIIPLLIGYSVGAQRAASASTVFAESATRAADELRRLKDEQEGMISKRSEAMEELARAQSRLEQLKSPFSKFGAELTPMVLDQIKQLEVYISKLNASITQSDVDQALAKRNELLEIAASRYRATGDNGRYLNDTVAAHRDYLEALIRLLPAEHELIKQAGDDYNYAAKTAEGFANKQREAQAGLKDSKAIYKEFQTAVAALGIEFQSTGDVQGRLQGEFRAAEGALRDYADAAAAAGISFDELMKDEKFVALLNRYRELKDLVKGVGDEQRKTASEFDRWLAEMGPSMQDLSRQFMAFTDGFSSAFGRSVGDALVLQESWRASFEQLWVDLLASTVANLATMVAQWVLYYGILAVLEAAGVVTHATAESAKTEITGAAVLSDLALWSWGMVAKGAMYLADLALWVAAKTEQLAVSAWAAAGDIAAWTAAYAEKIGLYAAELIYWIATKAEQIAISAWAAGVEIATWIAVHAEKLVMWAIELARIIALWATYIYMAIVAAYSSLGPIGFAIGLVVAAAVVAGVIAAVRGFAEGGIVTSPMLGMVGEAGPEAIIPLDRLQDMGFGGGSDDGRAMTIVLIMDGRETARVVTPYIPGEVRRRLGGSL